MGQQQLLLVILVTIIVGIATVVAINIFGTAADQANRDAVRQDLMGAATHAQAVFARPKMMGGLGREFDGLDIRDLRIPSSQPQQDTATSISNDNGTYTLSGASGNDFTITADPTSGGDDIKMDVQWDPGERIWRFRWDDGEWSGPGEEAGNGGDE